MPLTKRVNMDDDLKQLITEVQNGTALIEVLELKRLYLQQQLIDDLKAIQVLNTNAAESQEVLDRIADVEGDLLDLPFALALAETDLCCAKSELEEFNTV